MVKTSVDLISMADIARLAGQSRATVGNGKSGNPDSRQGVGRGPRGRFSDRTEVFKCFELPGRSEKSSIEADVFGGFSDQLRSGMQTEEALPLFLLLLAVMS